MKLLTNMRDLVSATWDLLLPRTCHVCGEVLNKGEKSICTECLANLPRTLYHREDMNPMAQRFAGFFPFRRASGHFFYNPDSEISNLIQDFKYRKFPSLACRMGEIMGSELFPTGFLSDVDVIVPIPIFWLKRAMRGYNQSLLLASGLSQVSGIPIDTNLYASRSHKTQTALSHSLRFSNTMGVFRLRDKETLRGKHILLLDDVCTTGSTLRSAALQILSSFSEEEGRPEISLLSLAVTQN